MIRAWYIVLVLAACGGAKAKPSPVPYTPLFSSAGDALLGSLPEGASAVLELDLERLRKNEVVGPLVKAATEGELQVALDGFVLESLDGVALAVLASYRTGEEDASTVVLLRGVGLAPKEGAEALDAETIFIAPGRMRDAVRAAATGEGGTMATDEAFLQLRDAAVPEGAPGASVRFTARLTARQQVAAAGRLGLDQVPASVSAWFDVADDAALVAILGTADRGNARYLEGALEALEARWLRRVLPRGSLRIENRGNVLRVVWIVGPARLSRWARRMAAAAAATAKEAPERE